MRLIDADALMKAMYHRTFETDRDTMWQSGCWVRYRAIEKVVKAQPTIEPMRWIPCSEIVDIPDHEVLCCDRRGEELVGWLSYVDEQWLCESNGEMMYNPVAWMPLPEPYREEGKQE